MSDQCRAFLAVSVFGYTHTYTLVEEWKRGTPAVTQVQDRLSHGPAGGLCVYVLGKEKKRRVRESNSPVSADACHSICNVSQDATAL